MARGSGSSNVSKAVLRFGASQLGPMHNDFVGRVSNHGIDSSTKLAPSDKTWAKQQSGEVSFALHHPNGHWFEERPLVPFRPQPDGVAGKIDWWASWYEEWAIEAGNLHFRTAGWGFYCAPPATGLLKLAVRAEWGPLERDGSCGSSAGQPHWHMHTQFPWVLGGGIDQERLTVDDLAVSIEDMHLAMAGWSATGPKPWHFPVGADLPEKLLEWSVITIAYVREQIRNVKFTSLDQQSVRW